MKMEGEKLQNNEERTFFFLSFFFFFSLFKTLKFVLGLPKWEFSTGKKQFAPGKKSGKWLCPSEKYSFYASEANTRRDKL